MKHLISGLALAAAFALGDLPLATAADQTARTVLTIRPIHAERQTWTDSVAAGGWVAAWSEASIATEIGDYRIEDLAVDVGDSVRKGDVVARLADDQLRAAVAAGEAALDSARAAYELAQSDARRAELLGPSGGQSKRELEAALIAERVAAANVAAAEAELETRRLRLAKATLVAPDDGVISARPAVLGAVASAGTELYRLVRQNRVEWRAEVAADAAARLTRGMAATLTENGISLSIGVVRLVGPTLNAASGRATVYVDLPATGELRPGAYFAGHIDTGQQEVLTLPESAVLLKDGTSFVFALDPKGTVKRLSVTTGARHDGRIAVVSGLSPDVAVAESGVAFLFDGAAVAIAAEEVKP
ncbi:efflux RND transporter periplasmic adaptor subunit [Pleomorphomonas oryzae]|uniref:efflux RND transporter periplasmic adaptor subunit n=1 Tax=Pleomorphomonas oryzae TaxID=261934 RepID=UPI0003F780CE|nr:efflux RND transporter periplasmic adaptor subunit [Pleomorphomonas oryzae]